MDQELFDKLPNKKQEQIERMAMRAMHLELSVDNTRITGYTHFTARPFYVHPRGDEIRFYDNSYFDVGVMGKHGFGGMEIKGYLSKYGFGSPEVYYHNIYRVDLNTARVMFNTLKWLEKKMNEIQSEIAETNYFASYTELLTAFVFATETIGGVQVVDGDRSEVLDIEQFLSLVEELEEQAVSQYAEEEEAEVA